MWIKKTNDGNLYEYIATHVDDVIVVSKEPKIYMTKMAEHFPIKKVKENPSYYLGNNLQHKVPKQMKVSLVKYIKEVLKRHESDHCKIRKENVPHSPADHPEMDDTPFLDKAGVYTGNKMHLYDLSYRCITAVHSTENFFGFYASYRVFSPSYRSVTNLHNV